MALKYTFVAVFDDGTSFSQTEEDVSMYEEGRTATTDLFKYHMQLKRVAVFFLKGNGHEYIVDLRDGHFQIDDQVFFLGPEPPPSPDVAPLELIYFRQVQERRFYSTKDFSEVAARQRAERYCFGWKALVKDKNSPNGERLIGPVIFGVF